LLVFVLLFVCGTAAGESQRKVIQTKLENLPPSVNNNLARYIDEPHAAIFDPDAARKLIKTLLNPPDGSPVKLPSGTFRAPDLDTDYFIIHVLRWADPSPTDKSEKRVQTVQAQNWYVYHSGKWSQENFQTAKRLFGVKRIWLFFIHLNRPILPGSLYEARYEIEITKKMPANQANLFAVFQLFSTLTKEAPKEVITPRAWGVGEILCEYVPSDVAITPKIVPILADNTAPGPASGLGDPQIFDNEGKYWWDFSVGVPIRSIRELSFDNVANTVTAKNVDQQKIFALVNLYYPRVDIKSSNFGWIPHFVGGIAIARQPLHSVLLAAGFGPHFANFYLGAVRLVSTEPATLKPGDSATPGQFSADLRKRSHWQFAFGINLPVKGIVKSIDKASK
jgi:hypothetical protein